VLDIMMKFIALAFPEKIHEVCDLVNYC